jgi:lipoprotein-anchoring transpeptidase ErfK/SrfK
MNLPGSTLFGSGHYERGAVNIRAAFVRADAGEPPASTGEPPVLPGTIARLTIPFVIALLGLSSCVSPDMRHRIVISIPEQRMALLEDGAPLATYPVSTSKCGLGDFPGSSGTPLGKLEIAKKIGAGAPSGAAFKDRRRTGEIVPPDAPGRDIIVTRILWLRGREPQNARAYSRYIYIHGTPEERNIGLPVSYGCIRMRSRDVIELFGIVGTGAQVMIEDAPLESFVPGLAPAATRVAAIHEFDESRIR